MCQIFYVERVIDMFVLCHPALHVTVWRALQLNNLYESFLIHSHAFSLPSSF